MKMGFFVNGLLFSPLVQHDLFLAPLNADVVVGGGGFDVDLDCFG